MQETQSSLSSRRGKGVQAAVDMVVRRSGRTPEDPVIVVTRELFRTKCNTAASVVVLANRTLRLVEFLDGRSVPPLEASREDILAFKDHYDGKALQTQSAYFRAGKVWFDVAEELNLIDATPYRRMPKLTNQTEEHAPPLSKSQIEATLDAITQDYGHPDRGLMALRDHAIINVMVHTAMRAFEVAGTAKSGITHDGEYARIAFMGKGQEPAKMKLADGPYSEVLRFWDAVESQTGISIPSNGPAFMNVKGHAFAVARDSGLIGDGLWLAPRAVNKIVKARLAAVKIVKNGMGAHSIRATAAVLAYRAGANLLEIQQFLRHKSLETTRIYLSEILGEAQMAAIDSIKLDLL